MRAAAQMVKGVDRFWTAGVLLAILVVLYAGSALAGNGLDMIGYGVESLTMGGADLAVARDTSALNTNPAGMVQITGKRVDIYSATDYPLDVSHQDQLGNDKEVANKHPVLADLGYVQRLASHPLALGIGLFAQGGAGYVYRDLTTPFGNQDDFSSMFRIAKLNTGGALEVSPSFSIGATLSVLYADLNQEIFPDTSFYNSSIPQQSCFGFELQDMTAMNYGYKLGAMLRINDRVTLGMAYTSKVNLDMEGGRYTSDLSAIGLGKVTYHDVTVKGLNLPQELGLGVAVRPTEPLLASVEVKWIDWSSAIKSSTLTARDPDNPGAPPVQSLTSTMDWRNQVVLAAGVAYELTENAILRAGYNYGRNPIPNKNLSPLLAAISEQTVTAGGGYRFTAHWRTDGGVEYGLRNKVRYTNPNLPFGPDSAETNESIALHLSASYLF